MGKKTVIFSRARELKNHLNGCNQIQQIESPEKYCRFVQYHKPMAKAGNPNSREKEPSI